jgi:hypothetical protein
MAWEKNLPLSLAREKLLMGQGVALVLGVCPTWQIQSSGWHFSVAQLYTPIYIESL